MDRGILTDGADYIFLDGRPTPFGTKQKRKLLLQKEYAVSFITCNTYTDLRNYISQLIKFNLFLEKNCRTQ